MEDFVVVLSSDSEDESSSEETSVSDKERGVSDQSTGSPAESSSESPRAFVVESIDDHQWTEDGSVEVFVRWAGYSLDERTWEPLNEENRKLLVYRDYYNSRAKLDVRPLPEPLTPDEVDDLEELQDLDKTIEAVSVEATDDDKTIDATTVEATEDEETTVTSLKQQERPVLLPVAVSKKRTPKKRTPKKVTPKKLMPEKTVSEKVTPKKITPKKITPEKTAETRQMPKPQKPVAEVKKRPRGRPRKNAVAAVETAKPKAPALREPEQKRRKTHRKTSFLTNIKSFRQARGKTVAANCKQYLRDSIALKRRRASQLRGHRVAMNIPGAVFGPDVGLSIRSEIMAVAYDTMCVLKRCRKILEDRKRLPNEPTKRNFVWMLMEVLEVLRRAIDVARRTQSNFDRVQNFGLLHQFLAVCIVLNHLSMPKCEVVHQIQQEELVTQMFGEPAKYEHLVHLAESVVCAVSMVQLLDALKWLDVRKQLYELSMDLSLKNLRNLLPRGRTRIQAAVRECILSTMAIQSNQVRLPLCVMELDDLKQSFGFCVPEYSYGDLIDSDDDDDQSDDSSSESSDDDSDSNSRMSSLSDSNAAALVQSLMMDSPVPVMQYSGQNERCRNANVFRSILSKKIYVYTFGKRKSDANKLIRLSLPFNDEDFFDMARALAADRRELGPLAVAILQNAKLREELELTEEECQVALRRHQSHGVPLSGFQVSVALAAVPLSPPASANQRVAIVSQQHVQGVTHSEDNGVENSARITRLMPAMRKLADRAHGRFELHVSDREASDEQMKYVHDDAYVEHLPKIWWLGGYDEKKNSKEESEWTERVKALIGDREVREGEMPTVDQVVRCIRNGAGAALDALDLVCRDKVRRAFACIRPPGHHCGRSRISSTEHGFCYVNNAALVARYAQLTYENVRKVAIIDIDAHHGDGTEEIFEDDPTVLTFSLHLSERATPVRKNRLADFSFNRNCAALRSKREYKYCDTDPSSQVPPKRRVQDWQPVWNAFFPFKENTVSLNDRSRNAVVELDVYTEPEQFSEQWMTRFRAEILPATRQCAPDLIVISLGLDARRHDDVTEEALGERGLEPKHYASMVASLCAVAQDVCDGKVLMVLEGGYGEEGIVECAEAAVLALAVHD